VIRLLADENFQQPVLRGLLLRLPELDVVTAEEVGLRATPDEDILAWAAAENRVVVTHDISTFLPAAFRRLANGDPHPGTIGIPWLTPIGRAVEFLLVLISTGSEADFEGSVIQY
jgi:hypothetical protein